MSPVLGDSCIYYIRLRAEGIISTDAFILFFVPVCRMAALPLPRRRLLGVLVESKKKNMMSQYQDELKTVIIFKSYDVVVTEQSLKRPR